MLQIKYCCDKGKNSTERSYYLVEKSMILGVIQEHSEYHEKKLLKAKQS